MSEAREQTKLMRSMKHQGVPAQKFTDTFALGITDMFIGCSRGLWLEAKFHLMPKLQKTALLPKAKITGNQIAWMRRFNGKPSPCAVIHFTGDTWLVCPIEYLHVLTELPLYRTKLLLRSLPVSRIQVSDLWNSYNEVMEYGQANPASAA